MSKLKVAEYSKADIITDAGELYAMARGFDLATQLQRAAHIVRCVNSHDELVSLLREVRHYLPDGTRYSVLRDSVNDALAKAEAPDAP